jgi:hypothetical protein
MQDGAVVKCAETPQVYQKSLPEALVQASLDEPVDVTQLFSLREHAIAKEPGSS